jgi:peroxiredoxin family protein
MKKWYFGGIIKLLLKKIITFMARKKLTEDKKKVKTGVTINSDVVNLMDELIEDIGNTNRSRYIEKLIKEDLQKRGKNINKEF